VLQAVTEQLLVPQLCGSQQDICCPLDAAQVQLPFHPLPLQVGQTEGSSTLPVWICNAHTQQADRISGQETCWPQAVCAVLQQETRHLVPGLSGVAAVLI
jgi:hypothetical protein